jgi:hypothetical protein
MKKKNFFFISNIYHYLRHLFIIKFGIFTSEKVLNNFFLNLFGIQVIRIFVSNFFLKIRRIFLFLPKKDHKDILFFKKNGYLQINNFLNKKDFNLLKKDFENKSKKFKDIYKGKSRDKIVDKFKFDITKRSKIIKKISEDKRLKNLIEYAEGKKLIFKDKYKKNIFIWFERIVINTKNSIDGINKDPQTLLHRDTFYQTTKIIFYLNDVNTKSGPFVYSPGSHKLNIRKILTEYLNSILNKDKCIRYKNNFFYDHYKRNELPLVGKANSLIITNTNGFHRREKIRNFSERKTLRFSFRFNPFTLIS